MYKHNFLTRDCWEVAQNRYSWHTNLHRFLDNTGLNTLVHSMKAQDTTATAGVQVWFSLRRTTQLSKHMLTTNFKQRANRAGRFLSFKEHGEICTYGFKTSWSELKWAQH